MPADTIDPVLTSATLPSVDVSGGGQTVTFSAGAFDTGSGVDRVYLFFDRSWAGSSGLESLVSLTDAFDSFSDGRSAVAVYFDPSTGGGTYNVTSALVFDKAGNFTQYSPAQLTALGIATSFQVTSNTPADRTDPTLTTASFANVDLTNGGQSVTFSAGALDSGTGVDRVYLYFDHGWEGQSGTESVVALTDRADSFADGSSAATVYFDPRTTAGTYTLISVIVYDKAGNFTQYSPAQLAGLGIASGFVVSGSNPARRSSLAMTLTGTIAATCSCATASPAG